MKQKNQILITGVVGLLGSILVGIGEFLLHFDALGRFSGTEAYTFMQGIGAERSTLGHFIACLSAPLYIVGFWHLMKMLEPANRILSRIGFFVMSYGIFVGAIWIGSRASIVALVNVGAVSELEVLISLYELRYENLLQITRICVLAFSIIYVYLVLTGRSYFPRWTFLCNPFLLIIVSFAIWMIAPDIGVYMLPIALNIAFSFLFLVSIFFSRNVEE